MKEQGPGGQGFRKACRFTYGNKYEYICILCDVLLGASDREEIIQ